MKEEVPSSLRATNPSGKSKKQTEKNWRLARPGIDSEASGCGVHACDVLYIVDVLGGELVSVVPVVVVQVLPDQGVGLNRAVRIHFRHVEVVQEVH